MARSSGARTHQHRRRVVDAGPARFRLTVIEHRLDGEHRFAIGEAGQYEITQGDARIDEGHTAPDVHARLGGLVSLLDQFIDDAFSAAGTGRRIEVRFQYRGAPRSVAFDQEGRAPDVAWQIVGLLRPLAPRGFISALPDRTRSL